MEGRRTVDLPGKQGTRRRGRGQRISEGDGSRKSLVAEMTRRGRGDARRRGEARREREETIDKKKWRGNW